MVGTLLHVLSILELNVCCSGAGATLWQVIAGRAIGGIGGAGMASLVSVIITGMFILFDRDCPVGSN